MNNENKNSDTLELHGVINDKDLFRAIADRAQVGIYVTDEKGNYEYVNQHWLQTTGFSPQSARGQGWLDTISPEDRDTVRTEWNKAIEAGIAWRGEYRIRLPDGNDIWVYGLADPQRDENGKVVRYAGMNLDITLRKRAEEQQKANADKYKALFLSSRDAVMTLEPPSWKFTSGNPAAVAMFGAKNEDDFLRYPPWELSPKLQADGSDSMGKAKEMIDEAMEKGVNLFEWTHKRVSGESFPAEVLLSRVEQDGKTYLHAVVRDITERRKLEQKIQESAEEKFQVIFQNSNDGLLLAETESMKFILGNNAICRMLGYSQEELKKMGITDIHPKESLADTLEAFAKQSRGEFDIARDIPVKKKDGTIFYADVSASPVMLWGKKHTLGIFRDTTERRNMEETLRKSEELYRGLFVNMLNGFAYCKMIYDSNNQPEDFLYIKTNPAFEKLTGLKNVEGKKVSEVIPGIRQSDPGLFEKYGNAATSGKTEVFETYVDALSMWFSISVYSPQKEYFVAVFDVITERKKEEAALKNKLEEIEQFNKFMVGRELKMADLKKNIEELKKKVERSSTKINI